MKFESQTHRQRFALGVICGLLPIVCLLFGLLGEFKGVNPEGWYNSISATYYANSKPCMIVALGLCSFFLATYKGYDRGDRIHTIIAAVSSLLIVIFPCAISTSPDYIGLFACAAPVSNVIHGIAAAILFGTFASMIMTQFTKGSHKRRNRIYTYCGSLIFSAMLVTGVSFLIPSAPGYTTMVCEFVMLEAFAVAWLIKSGVFPSI